MEVFIPKARTTITKVYTSAKHKIQQLCTRAGYAVHNREGQGTLDVAITVLISIVLGALILAGLYLLVEHTVLPTITEKIKEMFNYGD